MDLINKNILILAPHPDDELISSFFIIDKAKRLASSIKIIFVTSGECNYLGKIRAYKSLKLSKKDYASIREKEARSVMESLGITDFEFWRLPDLGLANNKHRLYEKLLNTIKQFNPDIIVSPSTLDLHKDHNSVGVVVSYLARKFQDIKIYYYIVHGNNILDSLTFNIELRLSNELKEQKKQLFNCYRSQVLYNKSFFLRHIDTEKFLSNNIIDDLISPIEVDFIGKDFVWIKIKYKNFFLTPLRVIFSVFAKDKICDFNATIKWNKRAVPIYLNKDKTLCSYIKLQKFVSEEGGYIIIPLSCFNECERLFIKLSNINPVFDVTGYIDIKMTEKMQRNKNPKVCVVIPCFNIAELCSKTVNKTLAYADKVVVVNDGSTDGTKDLLERLAKVNEKLHVLHLHKNMGKGNALIKGMLYAFQNIDFDLLITMDGDMQHRPEDIPLFKDAWQNGADMILGVRSWDKKVPLRSKIGNIFINKLCSFLLKSKVSDSQTGFRGFSKPLLQKIVDSECIKAGRYETELDIFLYSYLSGARVYEVKIPTIYIDGNASSHFNPILDSLRIIKEALAFYMRFYRAQRNGIEDKVIIDNS